MDVWLILEHNNRKTSGLYIFKKNQNISEDDMIDHWGARSFLRGSHEYNESYKRSCGVPYGSIKFNYYMHRNNLLKAPGMYFYMIWVLN